jgi:hypothetical protein
VVAEAKNAALCGVDRGSLKGSAELLVDVVMSQLLRIKEFGAFVLAAMLLFFWWWEG